MGVERVGDRLFITVPRRRYGIPSTLNYINLRENKGVLSPALRPYPNFFEATQLINVYRTRADQCHRLWMVDTGMLELPVNKQQKRAPSIVVFDLNTNRQIIRYEFKSADLPAANTPTGLASITVDITGDCRDAYAYVPDLTTNGIIVFSLRDMDSWRLTHNYFSFNPLRGNLRIAGQSFQWNDGIFSIALSRPSTSGCRKAYFHPLISTQEFEISTCKLKNKTASSDPRFFQDFNYIGDKGDNTQTTMHDVHGETEVMFFAEMGRDAVTCWNTNLPFLPSNVEVLAQSESKLSYPSDLHVTGNEVWVMANKLPKFGYSRLDPNEYNFFVHR
ncbi:L-dopachrome tautomerase yellow-f2-like [Leptidea sinapis]|uniref:L-dopachrome tautomerase yellow-f2-like n=1 Tax=Leptidea sinapis TaxID=189913 RepID=UPI0021C4453E|nr:L-dopachrome tautomerase yellow-f2-like [Leptidea sinapis]